MTADFFGIDAHFKEGRKLVADRPKQGPANLPPPMWNMSICMTIQVMDALNMDFPDNTFDFVWACESGEHMPDKKAYVQEMTRVLAPGGNVSDHLQELMRLT